MKHLTIFLFILFSSLIYSQWVQSGLNPGLGRSLYSDGLKLYASTNQGIYTATGTGEEWLAIGPPNDDISCVITIGNRIIAGSGMGNGVLISTNDGIDWHQSPSLDGQGVYCLTGNSSNLYAGTWGGGVFRSVDEGETWQNIGLNGKGIFDILQVDNILFAASPDVYSRIYYTSDNGVTWNFSSLQYPASDIRKLFYYNNKLFACDMGLWVSTDLGITWNIQYGVTYDSTGYASDIKMFRSITGYNQYLIAGVMFESIYISSDQGISWSQFNEGLINDWTFVDVKRNDNFIWAIRDLFGNAFRRPLTDLITSLNEENNKINNCYLKQNYPNPFNPNTKIQYSLSTAQLVTIKVYDLLGREIETLINEEKPEGTYNVEFSGAKLSSGVYFYKMQAGHFTALKKFILMK